MLMDPQTSPIPNGQFLRIWEFSAPVEDTEEFMERYMAHSQEILNTAMPHHLLGRGNRPRISPKRVAAGLRHSRAPQESWNCSVGFCENVLAMVYSLNL